MWQGFDENLPYFRHKRDCSLKRLSLESHSLERLMTLMQSLIVYLLAPLLGLLFWIFVAYMIFSWLIAFNIVNLRNPAMAQIYGVIRRICDPILDPIRKIIPPIGGLDMAFLVVVLGLSWIRGYVVPMLYNGLG